MTVKEKSKPVVLDKHIKQILKARAGLAVRNLKPKLDDIGDLIDSVVSGGNGSGGSSPTFS